jgi:dihydrofolate reductase
VGKVTVGAIVMGRRMFDLGEGPWGDDPPFRVPVFVVTHRAQDTVEKEGGTTFTFVTDGAETVQQLVAAGLVDEIQLHVVPLFLGRGKRLFDQVGKEIELERMRVVESPGVTHLKYRVLK